MSGSAFLDANKIQSRLDVTGHFAIEKIQNDLPCWRGLPIPRTHRSRRHDDNGGQARLRGFEDFLLRHPLGAFVVADHFFEAGVREFVGMLRPVHSDGSNGTGVDELLDTGPHGGVQEIFCAADVGIVNVLFVPDPQTVISGNVKNALGSLHGPRNRRGVAQISGDVF